MSSNGLYWSNLEGQIILSGITGTVVVTEVQSVPGYTIDEDTRSQTVVSIRMTRSIFIFTTTRKKRWFSRRTSTTVIKRQATGRGGISGDGLHRGLYSPDNGRYVSDSKGRVVITGLTAGMTITAKEVSTVAGYVLDSTPQTIEISEGDEVQTLYFYNEPEGGVEFTKVSAADKTERIPDTTFEIRKVSDDALVDTVTTGKDARSISAGAGDYYAVETDCPSSFRLDAAPIYFTVEDGQVTRETVTNQPISGILIHKVDPDGEGIPGAVFLLYDSNKKPIGQYTSDDRGYVYIDDLTDSGRFYLRELENEGYVVDDQLKTVYVRAGKVTEVEWENTPITGQIQITKTSEDYNSMNGCLPAPQSLTRSLRSTTPGPATWSIRLRRTRTALHPPASPTGPLQNRGVQGRRLLRPGQDPHRGGD